MAITDWPLAERPREKLLSQGANSLSDAELLAIFLRTGIPGLTAVDLARDLIGYFGSISEMLKANLTDFCQAKGLGKAKYVQLQAVMELSRRHLREQVSSSDAMTSSANVKQYLQSLLTSEEREVFHVLFLNTQHQIITSETLFRGTLSEAAVYPREIIRRGLTLNAAAMILAHNHPSGIAEPSASDVSITKAISQAANFMDMRVLDHMIVGKGKVVSLAERGLI